jgi:hypothetical protein
MIHLRHSFKVERRTAAFDGVALQGFFADLLEVTRRKLAHPNAAALLNDVRPHLEID